MTDETDNVDAAVDALLLSGNMPSLAGSTPSAQHAMRCAMTRIMYSSLKQGVDMCMESSTMDDTARLDWLADPSQSIGSVTLCNSVPGDGWSLRSAIDEAMAMTDGERAKG